MATIARSSGLKIELPDGFMLAEPESSTGSVREARRHGPRPLPTAEETPPLIEALAAQDLISVDSVTLDLTPETREAVRAAAPGERTVDLSLDIGADEGAVVLVEQDGVYSWHLPDTEAGAATIRRGDTGKHEARFRVALGRPTAEIGEFKKRGFVSDFIVGKIRAYVLKFAVEWGTQRLMHYLERNIRQGLVDMRDGDPTRWSPLENLTSLPLPNDRPARLLLFIHGTFSSSLGSYGSIAATAEGRTLLSSANERYDAVIGFDHPTLSVDPTENAQALLDALQSHNWGMPPHIDIVTFSRGGLVYRALAEQLLPQASWHPRIDRVIFAAVPNAGTHLAEPDNWHALLDLYTNLAAAAGKLLGRIPQLALPAKLFNELIQGLGALGKYLATQAVTKGDVPGLAAMQPDGPFIAELNRTQTGQPTVDTTFYCTITSEFEVKFFDGRPVTEEFPQRLAMTLTDRIVDRLFGVANDLVVDTASMTAIDRTSGEFIKDRYSFGPNPRVYHTIYFLQPEVARVLSRWLRLEPADSQTARSATGDWVALGEIAAATLPPTVDTNLLVTEASETLDTLLDDLAHKDDTRFVVVRRPHEGRILNYAYRRNEVEQLTQGSGGDTPLLDALQMHEFQASETRGPTTPHPAIRSGGGPTTARAVVLDDDRPVGVVPESDAPPEGLLGAEAAPSEETMTLKPRASDTASFSRMKSPQTETEQEETEPAPTVPTEIKVQCHFYAEMPGTVKLGEDATLIVSVSRELIEAATAMVTAQETAGVDTARKIILDVRARRNFIVIGNGRAEIDPPAPDTPTERYFSVRTTDPGEGELWVVARQGQQPLVTLKLRIAIVDQLPDASLPATARASTDEPSALAPPLCQLRVFERSNGDRISYEYDLDIPGVVFQRYESPPLQVDRHDYVAHLYREIEQRWISANEDVAAFAEEMREMGGSLFDQLFPHELQQAMWDHRDRIRHIQVISTEPFIPWEIVHLTEPGQPLPDESLFLAQLGVVRWLHGSYYPNSVQIRPGRARYIVPDYPHPDDKLPGTAAEAAYLDQAFGATAVTPHALPVRQLLRGPGAFDLLHFAGHGVADQADIVNSQLQLEGRVANGTVVPEYLSATAVEQQGRLQGDDGNRPMVVLNACQAGRIGFRLSGMGGFAAAFLARGAGIFVSTLWSVGDEPAKDFVLTLYDRLLAGAELADAVSEAREAARAAGDASWLCYVVYGHPNARIVVT